MVIFTCLYIFFARMIDVSLGTIRTVLIVKGKNLSTAIIAFFEVFIWFMVAREALNTDINSILIPIFYAGGYATGTLLGAWVSNTFLDGLIGVQVIVKRKNVEKLVEEIRLKGFGVSIVDLKNNYEGEKKDLLIIQINKKSLKILTKIIRTMEPDAFVVINETKYVQNGMVK
ncbi:MAG: DUF2179 domain-containing protein [Bacilli bacterium]|nr:DUF2179 domain-containing protein [Bacilli bacterium]